MKALLLSPHPDDEIIPIAATVFGLRDNGFQITNFACSLGDPAIAEQRKFELIEACKRANYDLIAPEIPYLSSREDPKGKLATQVDSIIRENLVDIIEAYDLIIAPSPKDGHPGHEFIGRIAIDLAKQFQKRLWLWGFWADLNVPTLIYPFDRKTLDQIINAVKAHKSQIERNNYVKVIRARAEANSVLAAERVFGFGSEGFDYDMVEVLSEFYPLDNKLLLGNPKILNPSNPFEQPTYSDNKYLPGRNKEFNPEVEEVFDLQLNSY